MSKEKKEGLPEEREFLPEKGMAEEKEVPLGKEMEEEKEVTLEQAFERLEQVISEMEKESSLEESFRMYHQGMELLKACNDKIDRVEKQIRILDEEGRTHEF